MPMWSNSIRRILVRRDFLPLGLGTEELDLQALDAGAVDVDDLEAKAIMQHLVAGLGRAAKSAEDEPGDRVVVLLRELLTELLVEVVGREGALEADSAVGEALDRLVGQVVLVLDLADDLLQQVLERDEAFEGSVLVDDDRHVLVRPPELGEHGRQVLGLGNDVRLAHELGDVHVVDPLLVEGLEQIAYVQSMTAARHSTGGRSMERATTSGLGTITSWTSLSARAKTL